MRWFALVVAMCGSLLVTRPVSLSEIPCNLVTASDANLNRRLAECGQRMGTRAVDAHIDSVWHLVPGLAGWKLSNKESVEATERAKDGKLHLVWKTVPPNISVSSFEPNPIYRGPSEEKSIALMINVSWGETYIPEMLQILRKNDVHATFFLDGKWVKEHPDLAKRIVAEGHAIGSHGSGHPDFSKISNHALIRQIVGTNEVIERVTGTKVRLLAPPSGSYDKRLVRLARERGMYTILWTADTVDWRKPPADLIVSRTRRGLTPGCLLLMHPTKPTVQALPKMLRMIRERGYHTKTVEDIVAERATVKPPSTLSTTPNV